MCPRRPAPAARCRRRGRTREPGRATPDASDGSTGTSTSTRRSRLRGIRSAEPMRTQSARRRRRRCRSGRSASVRGSARGSTAHPDVLATARAPRRAGSRCRARCRSIAHAGRAGLVQRLDHARVGERVQLGDDAALGAEAASCSMRSISCRRSRVARPASVWYSLAAAVAGEVVEQLGDVVADAGSHGEEAEVLVEPGRLRVVVAGADVAVATQAVVVGAHHERALGVRLQTRRVRTRRARRHAPAALAQLTLVASSKRAFSSTSTATCTPRSAARIRLRAIGLSPPAR